MQRARDHLRSSAIICGRDEFWTKEVTHDGSSAHHIVKSLASDQDSLGRRIVPDPAFEQRRVIHSLANGAGALSTIGRVALHLHRNAAFENASVRIRLESA